jgi:3-methyl-2-oxobutanoate hydroxymethyltransferase
MGSTTTSRKKVTIQTLRNLYKKNEPITVLTASDFPSGHVADTAGMEIVLVGDSLAMVAMGMEDTNEVTMDEMLLHCRSVNRAVKSAFTVSTNPNPQSKYTINTPSNNALTTHPDRRPPNGLL